MLQASGLGIGRLGSVEAEKRDFHDVGKGFDFMKGSGTNVLVL